MNMDRAAHPDNQELPESGAKSCARGRTMNKVGSKV